MVAPEIAIADSNTLSCMGLQSLLEEIIPMAVIRVFSSFEELMDDTPDMYAHYFVSAQIYFEHTAFFLPRKPKTIVLANGDNQPQLAGIPTLNIYQDEKTLIKNILQLHQFGHKGGHSHSHPHGHPHGATAHPCGNPHADSEHDLSPREIEVLVLITKGLINKEIADKLNISLTTVISHRKNITEKLGGIFVVGENDGGGNGKAGGGQPETEKKFPPQRCKTDFQPTEKNGRKNAADQKKGEKLFVKQVGGFRRIGFQRVQQHDFVDGDMIICHEIKADGIGHKKKRGQRFGRFRPQKQIAGGKKKQKNDQVDTDEVPAGAGDGIKRLQKNAVVGKKQQKGEQEVVCKRTD